MLPKPSKEIAIRLIQNYLPTYGEILTKVKKDNGWIVFQPEFHQTLSNLKITDYAKLYPDENIITKLFIVACFEQTEFDKINAELKTSTEEEKTAYIDGWINEIEQIDMDPMWDLELPKTQDEQVNLKEQFESLSEEEKTDYCMRGACLLASILLSFHNYFAIMIHGKSMTQLVNEGMQGNDDSFVKAIQIDSTVIPSIPFFLIRITRARQEGDTKFLNKLAYRQKTPPLHGKLRFPLLYLLFAILEGLNLLEDLKHREILDICDEAGLDRWQNRIEDVNYLTKRLKEYRHFQNHKLVN